MQRLMILPAVAVSLAVIALGVFSSAAKATPPATTKGSPDEAAIARARKSIRMLDDIYKKTIVLITDKYVHDEDDFAGASAAVLLFGQVTESGMHSVRLLDATGSPYDPKNVAQDAFEKEAIERLKAGAKAHEQVTHEKGQPVLRVVTPVPVVMKKCIMCHPHFADAKPNEPVGAISYSIPIE